MKFARARAATALSAALLSSVATSAFAQNDGADVEMGGDIASDADAIVVTARRMEENLQDVPISITVFNQEQLANRNVTNAQDLALYTPSLSASSQYGALNSSFVLRGFSQQIGTAPSVGVYFADVVAPRGPTQGITGGDGAGPGMMFDLQNAQVLKGSQGTLQGRNTTGGAILLVPQKPTGDLEGYVEGSVGNYRMWRLQGVLNAPLADTFRVRIGVDRQKRRGYLKNDSGLGPARFNGINYTSVRGSIVGDLTPDLENYTIVSYTKSNTVGDLQKLITCNALLAPGKRTVTAALRVTGRQEVSNFTCYHQVLNRALERTRHRLPASVADCRPSRACRAGSDRRRRHHRATLGVEDHRPWHLS